MALPILAKFTAPVSANATGFPPAAASAGYNTRTFGPYVTLGTNWNLFNFFSYNTAAASQQGDGSIICTAGATNSTICTAKQTPYTGTQPPNYWTGTAFGGGAYVEACYKYPNFSGTQTSWPSFYLLDIEHLCGVTTLTQWNGQAANYQHWIELDVAEADKSGSTQYGVSGHDWQRPNGGPTTNVTPSQPTITLGVDPSQYQIYGALWVPATSTKNGYISYYLNNVQVGLTTYYTLFDPSTAYTPAMCVANTSPTPGTALNLIDARHMCPILGTGNTSIYQQVLWMNVWQSSSANNITQ